MSAEVRHLQPVEPDEETRGYRADIETAAADPLVDFAAKSLVLRTRGYVYPSTDQAPISYSEAVMELAKIHGLAFEDAEMLCDRRVDEIKESLGFNSGE